jgi:hypothetical protein
MPRRSCSAGEQSRVSPWLVAAGLSQLIALTGCGNDAVERSFTGSRSELDAGVVLSPDGGDACKRFVSDTLIDHACFHELMGPHLERAAGAHETASGIDIDRAHTSFRVRLPASADGRYRGLLTYQARVAGDHAIFTRSGAPRVVRAGRALEPRFTHATEICAVLPRVDVYALEPQRYTVELESDGPEVVMVVEPMNEGALEDAYRFECGARPRPERDASVSRLDGGGGGLDATSAETSASGDGGAGPQGDGGECLVDSVLEHSCLHAQHGPFAEVAAVATGSAADVSKVHTAWRLSMPPAGALLVSFRPTMMGDYVFYLDRALPLSVRSEALSLSATHSEAVTACSGIAEARVYPLSSGARYEVEVGPTGGDQATLVIEHVQAFTREWRERFEACP